MTVDVPDEHGAPSDPADAGTDDDRTTSPISWPTLTADEAELEWPALRSWVDQLLARFPHLARVPPCWWRHNDLVELFSALRDHERASFAPSASAMAAMEWHRAVREVELRAETWIRRFTCAIPGRDHAASTDPDAWRAFVDADVQARRRRESH